MQQQTFIKGIEMELTVTITNSGAVTSFYGIAIITRGLPYVESLITQDIKFSTVYK